MAVASAGENNGGGESWQYRKQSWRQKCNEIMAAAKNIRNEINNEYQRQWQRNGVIMAANEENIKPQ
jgi:hypothetical protein